MLRIQAGQAGVLEAARNHITAVDNPALTERLRLMEAKLVQ